MLETISAVFVAQCNLWIRFGRDQSGNYAVLTALTAPVLLGIAGLGTEVGVWSVKHQTMQSAADSGAVSAAVAYYIQGNNSNLSVQANAVASPYGFVNGSNGVTVTVNQPPKSGTHTTTAGAVEVIITQPADSAVLRDVGLAIDDAIGACRGDSGLLLGRHRLRSRTQRQRQRRDRDSRKRANRPQQLQHVR